MKKLLFLLVPFLLLFPIKAEEPPDCFSSFENIVSDNSQLYRSSCNDYVVDFNVETAGYRLFKGGTSLQINYPGEQSYLSSNDPSNLKYVSLLNQEWVSIIYSLKPGMLKEDIILNSKPSLLYLLMDDYYSIPLQYSLSGLDIYVNEDRVAFVNQETTQIDLYFPALTITDNTGVSGSIKFAHDQSSDLIYLKIAKSYLENAVYPVTIDPSVVINPTSDTTTATNPPLMRHVVMTSDGTSHVFVQVGTQTATCGGSPLSGLLWFTTIDGATWTCQGQLSSDTTNKFYASATLDSSDNIYLTYSVIDNTASASYDIYYRKLTNGGGSSWSLGAEQKVADGDGTARSYSLATLVVDEDIANIYVGSRFFNGIAFQNTIHRSSNLSDAPVWVEDVKTVVDKFWFYEVTGGTYADDTVDANDSDVGDITLPSVVGDMIYIGSTQPYLGINWILSVYGQGGGGVWEYWNGSGWINYSAMGVQQNSNNSSFTSSATYNDYNGSIRFNRPIDWVATSINGEVGSYYYLRYRLTTVYTVQPIATNFNFGITMGTEQVTNAVGTMYKFEDQYAKKIGFASIDTRGLPIANSLNDQIYIESGEPVNSWKILHYEQILYFNSNSSFVSDDKGYVHIFTKAYSGSSARYNRFDGIDTYRSDIYVGDSITITAPVAIATDSTNVWAFYKDATFTDVYVYRKGTPPYDTWDQRFTEADNASDFDMYATVIGKLDKVWSNIASAYTDETTDASELEPADVPLGNTSGEAMYFGSTNTFDNLTWSNTTAGVGGTRTWQYWNGSAWTSLTLSGSSNPNFTSTTGYIQFTPPGNWATTNVNGEATGYYYVRALVATNYSTQPVMRAISNARLAQSIAVAEKPVDNKLMVVWTQDNTSPSQIKSELLDVTTSPLPSDTNELLPSITYGQSEANIEWVSFNPNGTRIVRTSDGTLHHVLNPGNYKEKCNGAEYYYGLLYFTSSDDGATWTCQANLDTTVGYYYTRKALVSMIKDDFDNIYMVYTNDISSTSSASVYGDIFYYKFTKGVGSTWTIGPKQTIATGVIGQSSYTAADIKLDGQDRIWVAAKTYNNANPFLERMVIFYSSDLSESPTWTESDSNTNFAKYWSYQGATYLDDTIDVNDADTGDVQMVAALDDSAYFGRNDKFNTISIYLTTMGSVGTSTWEYWNGSAWNPLQIYWGNINVVNLRASGLVFFSVPDDWQTTSINGETESYYYLRIRATAPYTNIPVGRMMQTSFTSFYSSYNDIFTPFMVRYGADRTGIIYMEGDYQFYLISRADSDPLDHWELPQQITYDLNGDWYALFADAAGTSHGEIFFAYNKNNRFDANTVYFTSFDGSSWSSPFPLFIGSSDEMYSSYEEKPFIQVLTDDYNVFVVSSDGEGLSSSYTSDYNWEPLIMLNNFAVRKGTEPYSAADFSDPYPLTDLYGRFDQAWSYDASSATYTDETESFADADVPSKIWREVDSTFTDMTEPFTSPEESALDRIWSYIGGVWTNLTDSYGNMVSQPGDAIYFGKLEQFSSLGFEMANLGVGGAVEWQYWNGSTWQSLSLLQAQYENFEDYGYVIFDPPLDWATSSIDPGVNLSPGKGPLDGSLDLYYIRALVTSGYSVIPSFDTILLDPAVMWTNSYLYLGLESTFNNVQYIDYYDGYDGTVEWQYWNGTAWNVITTTRYDDMNFDNYGGQMMFTPPGDWAPTSINGEVGSYYYVRAAVTVSYTSFPYPFMFQLGYDVTPRGDINDAYYFGRTQPFDTVAWDMIITLTASDEGAKGGGVHWEYWNGSTWRPIVEFVERSHQSFYSSFQEGFVQFKIPTDWTPSTLNGEITPHYYIRARVFDDYSDPPLFIQAVSIPSMYHISVAEEIYNDTAFAVWTEGYSEGNLAEPNYELGRYKYSPFTVETSVRPGANNNPNNPSNGIQYESDGTTVIATGGSTGDSDLIFRFQISDPDNPENLIPQIEIREVGTAFSNTATHTGASQSYSGTPITVSINLNSLANSSYHWQYRVCDDQGACSAWVSYGGNAENEADVIITAPVCGNNILETGEACDTDQLGGYSCTSFPGYGGGTLTCSLSCTYDVSACIAITPTPSPIPTATPVQSTYIPRTNSPTPTPLPELEIINVRSRTIGNEVEICWDTNFPSTGYVKYGISSLSFISSTSSELTTADHCVRIPNLEYDNTYDYEIVAESDILSATYESDFIIPAQLPITGESCSIRLNNDFNWVDEMVGFTFSVENGASCEIVYGTIRSQMPYSGSISKLDNGSSQAILDPSKINNDNGYFRINCQYNGNLCSAEDSIPALTKNTLPFTIEQLGLTSIITIVLLFLLRMISFPFYWLYAFAWAFLRRKSQTWGIVYDQKTRLPIPFAVVRIYDMAGNVLKQTVTDLEGKYGFILDGGNYSLKVSHSDYQGFEKNFTILSKEKQYAEDIALSLNNQVNILQLLKRSLVKFSSTFFNLIWVMGFVFSLIVVASNPLPLNIAILLIYLLQLVVLLLIKPPRGWGLVYDSIDDKGLQGAFVRVQDKLQGRQIDVQLTDNKGRYGFKLGNGEYILVPSYDGFNVTESSLNPVRMGDGSQGFEYNSKLKADFGMRKTN
jgi:hypothetical protein